MLVLSRKVSERIVIGSEIRITVVKVDRSQVRLGIEAPALVTVLREELLRENGEPEVQPVQPARGFTDPRRPR